LHDLGIVHGDLKPENILIKQTMKGIPTGKLIDFDDSYFTQRPPADRECIVGTPEYYSPELAAYLMDEDEEISGETLTLASDVFTLGIILCEYFTGEKPKSGTDMPTWLAVEKGMDLSFEKSLNPEIESLLRSMLAKTPTDRPTVKKVHNTLQKVNDGKGPGPLPSPPPPPTGPRLRGKGLEVTKLRGKGLNIKD
jgi:serine/threonine protein kinase